MGLKNKSKSKSKSKPSKVQKKKLGAKAVTKTTVKKPSTVKKLGNVTSNVIKNLDAQYTGGTISAVQTEFGQPKAEGKAKTKTVKLNPLTGKPYHKPPMISKKFKKTINKIAKRRKAEEKYLRRLFASLPSTLKKTIRKPQPIYNFQRRKRK